MRGETFDTRPAPPLTTISIHSPHARGDHLNPKILTDKKDFNPLPSCEGRPSVRDNPPRYRHFNPLPSCEGRPKMIAPPTMMPRNFNPLPSCEGRLVCLSLHRLIPKFQSTPLMRGETDVVTGYEVTLSISIHSPHARGDLWWIHSFLYERYFNPLPSCEGRLIAKPLGIRFADFNPLPSCEGRLHRMLISRARPKFQSTPLMRGETSVTS